uniref:Uncharacterized protein n=1 Tax=Kalanchoe fedtschenkoi TaxID=63787 RepID=A0A7N0T2T5_KALFE
MAMVVASLEHVLHLFDSAWFQHQVFTTQPPQNFYDQEEEEPEKVEHVEGARTLEFFRSHSHHLLLSFGTNFLSDSESPTSVLLPTTPKLHTIFSGKQLCGLDKPAAATAKDAKATKRNAVNKKRRSRGSGSSRSLTDLEFEELKGFQDLGFVFSEEDHRDVDLISMVPGLQRSAYSSQEAVNIQRPYLSEAWGVMEKRKEAFLKPDALIINHKIGQVGMENEMMMKEYIKCWAHSVASTIR